MRKPIDELQLFILSAKYLSITRAAKELGIRQSTATRQLNKLQDSLDMTLFKNHGGRIELTPAGQDFVPLAIMLEERIEAFKQRYGGNAGNPSFPSPIVDPAPNEANHKVRSKSFLN